MLGPDEAELAGLVTVSIRFMQNCGKHDPVVLGRIAVQLAHDHGWEHTHGTIADERAVFKQLLTEAHTEIMLLRAQLQEFECRSQS